MTNTTPLIALAQVQVFPLLQALYGALWVPPAVYREVVTEGHDRPGAQETAEAVAAGWLTVLPLHQPAVAQRFQLLGSASSWRGCSRMPSKYDSTSPAEPSLMLQVSG